MNERAVDTSVAPAPASISSMLATAPLLPVAVGLIGGVVLDQWWAPPVWYWLPLLVLFSAIGWRQRDRRTLLLCLLLAAGALGGWMHGVRVRTLPAISVGHQATPGGSFVRLQGIVVSEPRLHLPAADEFARWRFSGERTVFLLAVRGIEGTGGMLRASGTVRVSAGEPLLDLREGEALEVFGPLRSLPPPHNPGSFDWGGYLRRQGVVGTLYCGHRDSLRRLSLQAHGDNDSQRENVGRWSLGAFRRHVRHLLTGDLATGAAEDASLLEAMVIGHRSQLDRQLNEVFVRAGCMHFLAVSGMHVGMVMAVVWLIGRMLGISRRRCAWAVMIIVVLYVTVAEPRPPILRAGLMATLFCVSLLIERRRAWLNWLSAAAVLLVLIRPDTVFDVGFQLSFSAVLGVVFVSDGLRNLLPTRWAQAVALDETSAAAWRPLPSMDGWLTRLVRGIGRWALGLVLASAGAWLVGLPIVASTFHRVQPWGWLSTLLAIPLVFLVMVLGLLKILVTAIFAPAGEVVGQGLRLAEGWLLALAEKLGTLPGAMLTIGAPPWWVMVAFYGFLVLLVLRRPLTVWRYSQPDKRFAPQVLPPPRWMRAAFPVSALLLAVTATLWLAPMRSDRLTITVLSVGAGSATIIELPEGQTVLYDAGSTSFADVGRRSIVPYMWHQNIRRLDRVYLSHADFDHYNGLPGVLEAFPVRSVMVNEYFQVDRRRRTAAAHLLRLLEEMGTEVELLPAEESWTYGGATFERLWPVPGLSGLSDNETSTVLRVSHGGRSVLITGDIEDAAQRSLIDAGNLATDVLLLPHHGAIRPSSEAFIEAVGASVLVRSSGERMRETMSGLSELAGEVPLFNTADDGAVRIELRRGGLRVTSVSGRDHRR